MDNIDDNIFDTGNSGPSGKPDDGGAITAATGDSVTGRVDPDFARAATGQGRTGVNVGSGDGNPASHSPGGGEPVKRGRGRPRKDASAEPAPEKENSVKSDARNLRASFIEKTLYAIHLGVAKLTKCREFEIDSDDAEKLGSAVAGVLALHKVKITPKQEAYALLLEAAAQVYPPMIVSVYFRKQMEADARAKNGNIKTQAKSPPNPSNNANRGIHLRAVDTPPETSPIPQTTGGFDPYNIKLE